MHTPLTLLIYAAPALIPAVLFLPALLGGIVALCSPNVWGMLAISLVGVAVNVAWLLVLLTLLGADGRFTGSWTIASGLFSGCLIGNVIGCFVFPLVDTETN